MIRRSKPLKRSPIRRKNRPNKRPKSELVQFKKKLWKKFADWLKSKKGTTCFTCGKTGLSGVDRQAGHLFPKGQYNALRWDPLNIEIQCSKCNIWNHGAYTEFINNYIATYGREQYEALYAKRNEFKQWKLEDLKDIEKMIDNDQKQC